MARFSFPRRKTAAVSMAVLGVAGLALASAATLNLEGGTLAANTVVVASCQPTGTPISVGFDDSFAASASNPGYNVSGVKLKDVDAACAGKAVKADLIDASGASLGQVTGVASAGAVSLGAPSASVSASAVAKVSVVISD
ncbi:hypothetical protein [Cellulomonas timonensis]|uniref:hypothetical protein n=1 Tax=Cellulomonas timonensis TaxID=1689271 RepID=UPI000832AF21|nr:hypothetical protein [Cellulomonas timonensis]